MKPARLLHGILEELRPYPGREWMTIRIVLAVLLSLVLVMAFRIPLGWLSLYFCFVFAKPTTKETMFSGIGVIVLAVIMVPMILFVMKYCAEPTWLRLLVLAGILFGAFFLSKIMVDGDMIRNLAIVFAAVLTLPDVYPYAFIWERAAGWLVAMVAIGVVPLMLVTLLIRPEDVLPLERQTPPEKNGLLPDRWSNPEHVAYALKCTFAAMCTYFIYTSLHLHEIQTALMTCLIVALPKAEQITHKIGLRICGASIGAAIAVASAIWLFPLSNSLWLLLLVIGGGSAIAAWVAVGSARISYAGWQIALAQFMLVTHSFAPSTDLTILRDRLMGIMLGIIMMGITFCYLWPSKPSVSLRSAGKSLAMLAVVSLLTLAVAGCHSTEKLAPQTSRLPWIASEAEDYALPEQYGYGATPVLDADKEYSLSELADIALRNNPRTRIAWERSRMAAEGVGIAQSAYYPQINLMVAAGYEHIPLPLPESLFSKGYFYSDIAVVRPAIQVEWMLWDFGRSGARVDQAREQSAAMNFLFNSEHQQMLFNVCQNYYKLVSLRSSLALAEAALADARLIEEAAELSLRQGFARRVDYLQARQMVAQQAFQASALQAQVREAEVSLAESIGVSPRQPVRIIDITQMPLPEGLETSVEKLVLTALAKRPDLRARVAQLRAAEAALGQADAQRLPTLMMVGAVGPVYNAFSAEGGSWMSTFEAQYGVGLALKIPLFEGFRIGHMQAAAMAEKRQVEASLEAARNAAVTEVWSAFTRFENARSQYHAAKALVEASEESYEATRASFEQGFVRVTDVETQQVKLVMARESYHQARTNIFLAASLLQFATGQLSAEGIEP